MTIMSRSCAERCGLLRLMDKRWQGTAVGVGSAKILGGWAGGLVGGWVSAWVPFMGAPHPRPCPTACPLSLPAGRIHMVQLKAGGAFLPVSITVLDQEGMVRAGGLACLVAWLADWLMVRRGVG